MLAQMGQTRTLSILLVADDAHFRSGLRTLLGGSCTIVGEASSVETALSLTARLHPDLMLLDMKLEGGDGIALLRQLQERQEKVKPLVLSDDQEGSSTNSAMRAGAMGYMFKSQVAKQLKDAITTVSQGYVFLPPNVATPYWQWQRAVYPTSTTPAETPQLSNREQQVLQWAAWGASNETIVKKLHIAPSTVKLHFDHIFDKLEIPRRTQQNPRGNWEVNSRALAICKALNLGLVHVHDSPFAI